MLGFQPFVQQAVSLNDLRWEQLEHFPQPQISRATNFSYVKAIVYNPGTPIGDGKPRLIAPLRMPS